MQKTQFGNVSNVYEYEVPQLVQESKINEEGKIELDWSNYYDLTYKYFVIYRKKENETEWETIVSKEERYTNGKYVDNLGTDKAKPNIPVININKSIENNNIEIIQNSTDEGTTYTYYIEAYDSITNELLAISNVGDDDDMRLLKKSIFFNFEKSTKILSPLLY